MRGIVGMFGGLCSAIVIVLVARYGYKTADNEIDGIVSALLFATIAAGGLGGFAVAIRVWQRNRGWAAGIGVIAAVALTVNLSNSLGAIAGRGDVRTAERSKLAQSVTDDRAELARITREREAVGPFLVTTVDATQIAREALLAAERMTKLECEKRTARCRDRAL